MNFGEKFRTGHPSLKKSMSKSELDAYAEKLKSKINTANFDKEHNTIFVKNSTLTKEQKDYLQLKLDIYIYRLNQDKIVLNPFEACNIEANRTKADVFMEEVFPCIVTFIIELLLVCNMPSLPTSVLIYVAFLLCVVFLFLLITFGLSKLMYIIVSNYEDKKYIKALQESNEI